MANIGYLAIDKGNPVIQPAKRMKARARSFPAVGNEYDVGVMISTIPALSSDDPSMFCTRSRLLLDSSGSTTKRLPVANPVTRASRMLIITSLYRIGVSAAIRPGMTQKVMITAAAR